MVNLKILRLVKSPLTILLRESLQSSLIKSLRSRAHKSPLTNPCVFSPQWSVAARRAASTVRAPTLSTDPEGEAIPWHSSLPPRPSGGLGAWVGWGVGCLRQPRHLRKTRTAQILRGEFFSFFYIIIIIIIFFIFIIISQGCRWGMCRLCRCYELRIQFLECFSCYVIFELAY